MNTLEFSRIKKIMKEDESLYDMKIGDKFLYGSKMLEQRNIKKVGDGVTYYEVISINKSTKRIEYVPKFDILEKI